MKATPNEADLLADVRSHLDKHNHYRAAESALKLSDLISARSPEGALVYAAQAQALALLDVSCELSRLGDRLER